MLGAQLASPQAAIAAELADIRERGYLVVAVKDNWRPLGFQDATGAIVGLEIDIARELATAVLGDPNAIELRPVTNQERLATILSDEVDLLIAGLTMTPARMRVVSFSVPYYLDGLGLITYQGPLDLDHILPGPIAILNGSDGISALRYQLPEAMLVGVESYQEAQAVLVSGEAAAFAGDVTVLTGWVQEEPQFQLLANVFSAEPLAIAMPKGVQHRELRRLVNNVLMDWHDNGWLEERANHWGLP